MHAQDHHNPFAGNALPPTRGRRLVAEKHQKVSWLDVGSISRSCTSQGWFARDRFVQVSQTAVPHCKQIGLNERRMNYEHGYTERHSIDSLGWTGTLQGAWGADCRGADGIGHRPWRSANHANRGRAALDWWVAVEDARGGYDGSVDGLPAVLGVSGGRWRERGGKRWCLNFLSDCSSKYCIKYCELQHCAA